MSKIIGTVVMVLADDFQQGLLRTALHSMNLGVRTLEPRANGIAEILALTPSGGERTFFILDARRLASLHLTFDRAAAAIRSELPAAGLALMLSDRLLPPPLVLNWAREHGASVVFGRLALDRYDTSLEPLVRALDSHFETRTDRERLRDYTSALLSSMDRNSDPYAEAQRTWSQLMPIQSPERLMLDFLAYGAVISDRSYRLRTYTGCFIGQEACDWLQRRLGVDRTRAVAAGELLRQLGAFYHVTREQPFRDDSFYYRPNQPGASLHALNLDAVILSMRGLSGLAILDRQWRGQSFTQCFVGSEAVAWMVSKLNLTLAEALTLGQSLLEAGVFRHVSDAHDFVDAQLYYRFALAG